MVDRPRASRQTGDAPPSCCLHQNATMWLTALGLDEPLTIDSSMGDPLFAMLESGPIFAVPTPFCPQNGNAAAIDERALMLHLAFLHKAGVRNIVAGGTTGEFASLTLTERTKVTEICARKFKGKTVAHVSSCCLEECVQLCKHAQGCGCAAVLLLPPFYFNGAAQKGLEAFLSSVLERCDIPCFLYNFPKHAGNAITPDMYSNLYSAHPKKVVGIKDSCSIESAEALKTAVGTLPVYIGNDNKALAVLQKGMRCITGACNACPELMIGLHEAYSRGDEAGADGMQSKVREWMSVVAKMPAMGEVPAVKAALNHRIGHAAGSQGDEVDEGGSYGMVCRPPLETLRKGADSHQDVVSWMQTNFSPS